MPEPQILLVSSQTNYLPGLHVQLLCARTSLDRPTTLADTEPIIRIENAIASVLIARPNYQISTLMVSTILVARASLQAFRLTNAIFIAIAIRARSTVRATDTIAQTANKFSGRAYTVQASGYADTFAPVVVAAVDRVVAYAGALTAFEVAGRAYAGTARLIVYAFTSILVARAVFTAADTIA